MSRYHYSRHAPSSARSESLGPRQSSNGHLSKPVNSIATTNNNHTHSPPMTPKSSYIPLVRNSRPTTSEKRDFVQIPVKREDGTTVTHNGIRSIPINFINETTPSSSNTINSTNGINHIRDTDSPPRYASLLRPSPKYFQHHPNNTNTATARDESEEPNSQQIPITLNDNLPRLQTNSRRLSLTIPVMTPTAPRSPPDDDQSKQNSMNSPVRSIPVRLSQPLNVASIPTNSTRISSAILRSSPPMNPLPNHLQRQKTDLVNNTISSDFTSMPVNISPVRRAELMAREAIQGIARFQQQQQQAPPLPTPPQPLLQQRKLSISDGGPSDTSVRSPLLSRRVIVNLKNNQSVSLDSRISSATSLPTKSPSVAATSRSNQRNNLYHIPVLHEIQIPPHPATVATESLLNFPRSPASNHRNPNNYKNEFRMEIPVSVVTNNDQENLMQSTITSTDGILDYDPPIPNVPGLRLPSTSSNQALKSILKRSASRETVLRKNVSFMNA